MELKGKRVLFLGDSITEGAAASSPQKIFHKLLKKTLGLNEAINCGVGGTRIARQKKPSEIPSYDEDFNLRYDHANVQDVLVVFGGTNDYGHGNAPLGVSTDRSPDTFFGALHLLCTKALRDYGQDNVFFVTPLRRKNDENPLGEGKKSLPGAPLREYVSAIRETVTDFGFHIVDLFAESRLNPNLPENEKYFADGLHPTDDGHKLLADILAEAILKA